jgi:membrane-associated phospholipid phosphatase
MRRIDRTTASVIAAIVCVLTAVGTVYCDSVGHDHYTVEGRTHIHDIGHDVLPYIDVSWPVKRALEYGWSVALLGVRNPAKIVSEITLVASAVLLLRLASMTMTILPDPGHKDAKMSTQKFIEGGVHDKVFSGHTAFATVVTLVLIRHGVWNSWGYMYPLAMGVLMIASRGHYTVDVFLGFIIAYLVHALFYSC